MQEEAVPAGWRGGSCSTRCACGEGGSKSAVLRRSFRGLLVLVTHDTHIAKGWEREGDNADFVALFSPDAYAIGINVEIWIMTH